MLFMNIYSSIRLNLGIKRALEKNFFPRFIQLRQKMWEKIFWFDSLFLFPLYHAFERYFYNRIVYHYGADYRWNDQRSQNLEKSTQNLGYGLIHYAIIRNQKPNRVLCIGSMYGFIPYMMAKACMENQMGFVDFVDASYDMKKRGNKHYYGQGFWKTIKPNEHFRYLGVNKYIATHLMTSAQFAKKENWNYDYIYLDGDHSYKGAMTNIRLFWPRLNQNGFLCFHDIDYDRVAEGVRFEHGKAWRDLSFLPYKFCLTNHYSGLGFIQKLDDVDIKQLLQRLQATP